MVLRLAVHALAAIIGAAEHVGAVTAACAGALRRPRLALRVSLQNQVEACGEVRSSGRRPTEGLVAATIAVDRRHPLFVLIRLFLDVRFWLGSILLCRRRGLEPRWGFVKTDISV